MDGGERGELKPVVQFLFCIGISTWSRAVGAPTNLGINHLINVELFEYWSHTSPQTSALRPARLREIEGWTVGPDVDL